MSSGNYPSIDHTRSPRELIGPRHRLPAVAPPRAPLTSNSVSSTNAHTHTSWMSNKHHTSSNYHENPGFYGHSSVARDYATISRAHCNDESSAWTNPHFSNPLGNPPFGGVIASETTTSKGDIQKESMDLSGSHGMPVVIRATAAAAAAHKLLTTVNGDGHRVITPASLANADCKKEAAVTIVSANSSTASRRPDLFAAVVTKAAATNDDARVPETATAVTPASSSDNVEYALESLFHSDAASSVVTSTPPSQNPKDMCVESVEKILKSPSPDRLRGYDDDDDDDDDLTILYDSHASRNVTSNVAADVKPSIEKSAIGKSVANDKAAAATKVVILKKKNCDSNVKTGTIVRGGDSTSAKIMKPIKIERLNDVKTTIESNAKKSNCDARKEVDQSSSEHTSSSSSSSVVSVKNENRLIVDRNVNSCKAANQPAADENFAAFKIEPTSNNVRSEEITYVQVENELEKMFAGIEDTTVNGSDSDPLARTMPVNLSTTSIDAQNNLSLISSNTQHSRSSTNLFDSVNVPAKMSKKKTSKKSKPAVVSIKSIKDNKQKSSNPFKESSSSSSLDSMRRVPVIHVEGSKENPISAQIINSIKLEEDDVSDGRTSAKRKLGKSDRAIIKSTSNFSVKNYDPATSDATWVCIFCNLCAYAPGMAGEATGDLFGPYFIRTPEQINLDESKIHSWKTTHLEPVKKKQKRSVSIESGYMDVSTLDEQKSLEVWAHENCIIWASGVHLIGSKLIGLEEAVTQALETICAHCSNKGASIGCRARHCNSCAHYSCAIYTGWKLDTETFISTCSVHSVPPNV